MGDIDIDPFDPYDTVKDPPQADPHKPGEQTQYDNVAESNKNQAQGEDDTDDSTFAVGIEETEASKRCNLGNADYRLSVNDCDISLRNQHVVLYSWPYKSIRRCGKGNGVFIVEAGRRAVSGEGFFHFKTTSPEKLLNVVTTAMRVDSSRRAAPPANVEELYAKVNKPKNRQKEQ